MTARIQILDIETENHAYFGALASPRHPQNYVVAVGQALDTAPFDGKITGEYFESRPSKWLTIPDDVWLVVAHNAAFEMDWMLHTERDEIMKFLKRGGRIFCTAYAEYLLTNQQETYPALDVVAPKYGGTHKVDGVKLLWEQGKLTSEIDKDLLFDQYLLGSGGDIDNTRRVFYGQVAELQRRGMWDMALLRMEGLIYNCFAMDSGLHVHRSVAFTQKEEQEAKLAELVTGFKGFRQHIPEYVEFKDTSDFHMSAWLFGGPVKYRIRDTWFEDDGVTPKYEKVPCYKFEGVPGSNIPVFVPIEQFASEADGASAFERCVAAYGACDKYKAGKNKGLPKEHSVDSDKPKLKWYDRQAMLQGVVPLDKLPQDVQKSFKDEFTGKRKLADGSPVFSTGADAIEMLSKRQEFDEATRNLLTSLLSFAKIDKDLGTYYLREQCDEEGNVVKQSGMLQYLTEQDIVYHVLNTTSTVTTRLSSNRPNMQNIPRGDTSEVKKMFTSRFNNPVWLLYAVKSGLIPQDVYDECTAKIAAGEEVGAIIEADYSALEVVTLAAFSKDKNLVKALLENIDMHCMRLAQQLGEPYEDVLLKCKDENHPQHKAYKKMRTDIKPKAFAYQYGATAMGIAFATGCTVEEAQAFIDAEKKLFPEVEAWYEKEIFETVERTKTIHREQTDDGKFRVYGRGTWSAPAGTTFEFRQYPKSKWVDGQRIEIMEFKPTQMRNYPIQGESGFFVQGIAGQVVRWLISRDFFGGRVFIINQVHDALYLDCCRSVLQEVAVAVKHIMESLPTFFKAYGYDLGVPFPAEVEAGPSMYEKGKVQ
ncbi:MAG TPA: DNA polymerase [Candidatus Acidoferrum sp.]|nr:DNA polymerase [Candidatus Acidoferrum sp.]